MKTIHDYENWGRINFDQHRAELLETYSGTDIIKWHGRIGDQLVGLMDDSEKGRNFPYYDKLRKFLDIWRSNEITGSINRETIEILKSAADILAVDNWNLRIYFSSLATQLKVLIGSEEQLPRNVDMDQNEPMAGTGSAGRGAPPMSPSFGPEDEKPPGAPEAPGTPGEEGEGGVPAPGEEGTVPPEEGAPGEGPMPGKERKKKPEGETIGRA